MQKVELYTDGACSGNPGPGGWAYLLRYQNITQENAGGSAHTTNNQMELSAAIYGLKALKKPCEVILYTDSKYLLQGATLWLKNWEKTGWKTASKKPVLNQELWQAISALAKIHTIEWHWVKGHVGHIENERVDFLAVEKRDEFKNLSLKGLTK